MAKNIDEETEILVGIVLRAGRPMSSPMVGREYTKETGLELHQTSVYRRLIDAVPNGLIKQNHRVRWVAVQNTKPSSAPDASAPAPTAPTAPSFPKDKARMAASMYAKVAEILNSDSPDVADAMSYKRSADLLMAVV